MLSFLFSLNRRMQSKKSSSKNSIKACEDFIQTLKSIFNALYQKSWNIYQTYMSDKFMKIIIIHLWSKRLQKKTSDHIPFSSHRFRKCRKFSAIQDDTSAKAHCTKIRLQKVVYTLVIQVAITKESRRSMNANKRTSH